MNGHIFVWTFGVVQVIMLALAVIFFIGGWTFMFIELQRLADVRKRRTQEPKVVAPTPTRDWPEDFSHENGQYMNTCRRCQCSFTGHKRRVICKWCVEQSRFFMQGYQP